MFGRFQMLPGESFNRWKPSGIRIYVEEVVNWIIMMCLSVKITVSKEGDVHDTGSQPNGLLLSLAS